MGGKAQEVRSITGRYKNRQGDVKNSIGNVETKELICTSHGHGLRGGGGAGREGQGRQKMRWENGTTVIA